MEQSSTRLDNPCIDMMQQNSIAWAHQSVCTVILAFLFNIKPEDRKNVHQTRTQEHGVTHTKIGCRDKFLSAVPRLPLARVEAAVWRINVLHILFEHEKFKQGIQCFVNVISYKST